MSSEFRVFGLVSDSIVDGPGLRYGVFVQGCSHGCPGCHNPESHDPAGGQEASVETIVGELAANKLISGVTLSGGEPFEQATVCAEIGERAHDLGLNVWTYTGYRYEDLEALARGYRAVGNAGDACGARSACGAGDACEADANEGSDEQRFPLLDALGVARLLDVTDVLVDGPFVESLKSLGLQWRGSSNQRVIDMAATRDQGTVVLWSCASDLPEGKPANW